MPAFSCLPSAALGAHTHLESMCTPERIVPVRLLQRSPNGQQRYISEATMHLSAPQEQALAPAQQPQDIHAWLSDMVQETIPRPDTIAAPIEDQCYESNSSSSGGFWHPESPETTAAQSQAGNRERLALHLAELEKQDKYLREEQRYRFHIIPDGNCLYRAVCKALYGEQSLHAELRERTVHYVADHLDIFNLIIEGDIGEFLINAAQDGAWAGYPELLAMSHMLEVNIRLTTGGRPECPTVSTMVHRIGGEDPSRPSIWLSWLSNGHYDAVFEQPLPNPEYERWYRQNQAQRQRDEELAKSMAVSLSKMYIEQNPCS
ncbi:hypothetical protein XENTR_v10015936 [Xenopus tropicalis]|uniref:OTU domain-containing protein 1 n=2 Tax=Xenopus tropicalis TaxID=8364 RepID=A0A8J0QIJ8_XENTR|nr:OTU domain-containing protein 1 [Xenopus tropicalis]KAE8596009.1 hypothetical protein XENTR_v10015936 [Xenopus tropicalis]|eukprot:XP_002933180.1 PREDICTED: OTU domain-containing protein 1 [Xenopus tropicalis]